MSPYYVWSAQYLQMQDNFSSHLYCNLLKMFVWRLCAESGGKTEQWVLETNGSILLIIGHHWKLAIPRITLTLFKCLLGQMCVVCGNMHFRKYSLWIGSVQSAHTLSLLLDSSLQSLFGRNIYHMDKLGITERRAFAILSKLKLHTNNPMANDQRSVEF